MTDDTESITEVDAKVDDIKDPIKDTEKDVSDSLKDVTDSSENKSKDPESTSKDQKDTKKETSEPTDEKQVIPSIEPPTETTEEVSEPQQDEKALVETEPVDEAQYQDKSIDSTYESGDSTKDELQEKAGLPGLSYPDMSAGPQIEMEDGPHSVYEMSDEELEYLKQHPELIMDAEIGSRPELGPGKKEEEEDGGEGGGEGGPSPTPQQYGSSAMDLVNKELSRRKWQSAQNLAIAAVPELLSMMPQLKADTFNITRNLINSFFDNGPMSLPSKVLAESLTSADHMVNSMNKISAHYGIAQNADKKIVDSTIKGKLMRAQSKAEMKGIAEAYVEMNDMISQLGDDPLQITDQQLDGIRQHCQNRIQDLQIRLGAQPGGAVTPMTRQERMEARAKLGQYQETLQNLDKKTNEVRRAQRQAESDAKRAERDKIKAINDARYDKGNDVQQLAWDLLKTRGGIELDSQGVPLDGKQVPTIMKAAFFKMQGMNPKDPQYAVYQRLYDANNNAYQMYQQHVRDQGRANHLKPDGTWGGYVSSDEAVREARQQMSRIFKKYGMNQILFPEELDEMAQKGNLAAAKLSRLLKNDPMFIKYHNQIAFNQNALNLKNLAGKIRNQGPMRGLSSMEQEAIIADLVTSQLKEVEERQNSGQYMPFRTEFTDKLELYRIAFDPANYKLLTSMQSRREYLTRLRDDAIKRGDPLDSDHINALNWMIDAMDPYTVDPSDYDKFLDNTNFIREYFKRFNASKKKEKADSKATPKPSAGTVIPPTGGPTVPPATPAKPQVPTETRTKSQLDLDAIRNFPKEFFNPVNPQFRSVIGTMQERLKEIYAGLGIEPGTTPQELADAGNISLATKLSNDDDFSYIVNSLHAMSKFFDDESKAPSLKNLTTSEEGSMFEIPDIYNVGETGTPAEEAGAATAIPAEEGVPAETAEETAETPSGEHTEETIKEPMAEGQNAEDEEVPADGIKPEELTEEEEKDKDTLLKQVLANYDLTADSSQAYKDVVNVSKKIAQELKGGMSRSVKSKFNRTVNDLLHAVKFDDEAGEKRSAAILEFMERYRDSVKDRRGELSSSEIGRWNDEFPKKGFWDFYKDSRKAMEDAKAEGKSIPNEFQDFVAEHWNNIKDGSMVDFDYEKYKQNNNTTGTGEVYTTESRLDNILEAITGLQNALNDLRSERAQDGGQANSGRTATHRMNWTADRERRETGASVGRTARRNRTRERREDEGEGEEKPENIQDEDDEKKPIPGYTEIGTLDFKQIPKENRDVFRARNEEDLTSGLKLDDEISQKAYADAVNDIKGIRGKRGWKDKVRANISMALNTLNNPDSKISDEARRKSLITAAAYQYFLNEDDIKKANEIDEHFKYIDTLAERNPNFINSRLEQTGPIKNYYYAIKSGAVSDDFSKNFIEMTLLANDDPSYSNYIFGGRNYKIIRDKIINTARHNQNMKPAEILFKVGTDIVKMNSGKKGLITKGAQSGMKDLLNLYIPSEELEKMDADTYDNEISEAYEYLAETPLMSLRDRYFGLDGTDDEGQQDTTNVETNADTGENAENATSETPNVDPDKLKFEEFLKKVDSFGDNLSSESDPVKKMDMVKDVLQNLSEVQGSISDSTHKRMIRLALKSARSELEDMGEFENKDTILGDINKVLDSLKS